MIGIYNARARPHEAHTLDNRAKSDLRADRHADLQATNHDAQTTRGFTMRMQPELERVGLRHLHRKVEGS